MANKNLFKSAKATAAPANTVNEAGGLAYSRNAEETLAQLACTGCTNNTYYTSAEDQLNTILTAAKQCSAEFLAKTAIYARTQGFMKDMPALLMAVLSVKNPALFKKTYPKVIDNAKMMRNLVQIVRSGKVGRKSFGRAVKNCITRHLNSMSDRALLNATVGNDPSLADVIRLTHPKPKDKAHEEFFRYALGYPVDKTTEKKYVKSQDLPQIVQEFENWKKNPSSMPPSVDFQLITGTTGISDDIWAHLAANGNWHFTRMNLNTFGRHNLYNDKNLVDSLAKKIKDPVQISKAKVFPYQLYTAASAVDATVPAKLKNALQDALDVSVENVPMLAGKTAVFIDGSGSMGSPVTGQRTGATTVMSCLQVASLIGAGLLKKNADNTDLFIFDTSIKFSSLTDNILNPRDSLLTITNNIVAKSQSGGTAISVCLEQIKKSKTKYDNVIIISDNESWADYYAYESPSTRFGIRAVATKTAQLWKDYNKSGKAKLVLVDLQPGRTTQITAAPDVLNVGGFSNAVFDVIASFVNSKQSWIDIINAIDTNNVQTDVNRTYLQDLL